MPTEVRRRGHVNFLMLATTHAHPLSRAIPYPQVLPQASLALDLGAWFATLLLV